MDLRIVEPGLKVKVVWCFKNLVKNGSKMTFYFLKIGERTICKWYKNGLGKIGY